MVEIEKSGSVDAIEKHWAFKILARSFKDLAVAYALRDRDGALQMLAAVNRQITDDLMAARQELPEGVGSIRRVGQAVHDALTDAKAAIEKASNPH